MLFRTHITFGILIFLLLFSYFHNSFLTLVGIILGTVILDIDSRKSKIGKKWYFRPIQWFTSHRKFFHSLLFIILLTIILAILSTNIAIGFLIGSSSHLFLDALTKRGITPLHPFTKRKIKGPIRTNSIPEDIIFVLLLLVNFSLILITFVKILK
jgi:inner membrane protein